MALFFLRPSERPTRHQAMFFHHFWYQSVPLVVALFHSVSVFQKLSNISSKSTKTKSPDALYRRPLAAGQHHTVPPGNSGEHTYKTLPSYTQHSVTAVSKLSSSSVLHFCVSASSNTRTIRSSLLHKRSHAHNSAWPFGAPYRLALPGLHTIHADDNIVC